MNKKQIEALKLVIDFVERWNKEDNEKDIAEANLILQNFIEQNVEYGEGKYCPIFKKKDDTNYLYELLR